MTRPRRRRYPAAVRAAHRVVAAGLSVLAVVVMAVVPGLLVAAAPASAQTTTAQTPDDQPPRLPPVQIVVLVDESGSLSADGVAQEKEAARTIALGAPSPDTTVSVVGFGSSDGTPGQTAAVTRCAPTRVDSAQARDALARCIGDVHARTPQEGNHTDHVAALRQALTFLDGPEGTAKIVFLLTDGRLDVEDSPAYGRDLGPQARTEAALDQVPDLLTDIRDRGGQVWPLGFGADVDTAALAGFATGEPCTPVAPRPDARVVAAAPNTLTLAVIDAYRSAACVGADDLQTGVLPNAGDVELAVDIPAIASDSSILVYKRDPRVRVTYVDPNGTVAEGAGADGSVFAFSGQGTETESLHITDPVPGVWTVRLQSTSDIPPQDVAATVLFQGAVNAVLVLTPPQPAAGEQVQAAMQIRARRASVTDPALLTGLTFATVLTGPGVVPEQRTALTDDDGDGTFTGSFTVPQGATGDLTFTGTVSGVGIGGDERVVTTTVRPQAADLAAQLRLTDTAPTVVPGTAVTGEASIENRSGQERRLRLQVVEPGPGTVVTVEPAVLVAQPSGTSVVPFTLRFGDDTLLGGNQVLLQAVDDAAPATVVAQQLVAREVTAKPLVPAWLLWSLVALAVVVAVVAVLALRRAAAARRRRAIDGLRVELRRGGSTVNQLTPLDATAHVFRFTVGPNRLGDIQLDHADSHDTGAYELRRRGAGLELTPAPPGVSPAVSPGGSRTVQSNGESAVLIVHDDRGGPAGGRQPAGSTVGAGAGASARWDPFGGLGAPPGPPSAGEPPHSRPPFGSPPPGSGWRNPDEHWGKS